MLYHKFKLLLKYNFCIIINKRLKWTSENIKLFADLFDMQLKDFKRYRFEKKLPILSADHIKASAAFCESLNVPKKEWLKYPTLLKEKPLTLQQQYLQLLEGGFTNVDPKILAHYRKCIHKKVSALKLHGLISNDISVAESFTSYLSPRPSDLPISDLTDDNTFTTVHHIILTRYLMWRFETTQDTVEKFYRIYSLTKIKSFDFLCQNFAIAEELGYRPKKVLKYGYLLSIYPQYLNAILAEMPFIAGMDVRKAMKMYPKLIGIPPKNYLQIYDYLKRAKISDEAIQTCMNIFQVSPETVKARLEEIQGVPELKVLINNPRILKLIIHHNEARSRLSFLQEVKLKCATTSILGTNRESFNLYLRAGKDVNNTNEVLVFVKRLLKSEDDTIETNLKKHKYFRHVPLIEIERSYKFLKKRRFTNQSIANVTQVLLYPSSKLETALQEIKERRSVLPRRFNLIEKLNLMLYFIEREHHFTGNGIWPNEEENT